MSNNSSKQVLLSVIGVAILVIAVVGVSFAFFTYTRTGSEDNVITTGSLTFSFTDTDYINLTNHFPITTSEGVALTGTDNVCTFTVTGSAPAGTNIGYTVYAIDGDTTAYTDKTRFKDSEVFVYMTSDDATFSYGTGVNTGTAIANLTNDQLGTGTVTGGTAYTAKFTVKMWVDSSVVTIGDAATDDYTASAYGNLYYTMRIKVEAQA